MLKAAILGFGTVGSGTLEVLECNADTIARNAGEANRSKIYSGSARFSERTASGAICQGFCRH